MPEVVRSDEDDGVPSRATRSRDELRRMVLGAGTELLWEEGLAIGAEHVTFKRVFARLERSTGIRVTHASVIRRIWQNQEEYQQDLLARLAAADQWNMDVHIGSQVRWALGAVTRPDLSTAAARWRTAIEMLRVGGATTFRSVVRSEVWPRWLGTWALVAVDPDAVRAKPVFEGLRRSLKESSRRHEQQYAVTMRALGLRVRAPFTVHEFAVLVGAFTLGCAIRDGVDAAEREPVSRPTGPDGGPQQWDLFTVGVEALTTAFLEVDPDWRGPGRTEPIATRNVRGHPRATARLERSPAPARPSTTRRRREELRELLLRTGLDLLVEEGLGNGVAHVTFKRVFERLEATTGVHLTNAAVIGRVWRNQEEFQTDVLAATAAVGAEILPVTVEHVLPVLSRGTGSTVEERWRTMQELCRIGAAANARTMVRSRRWQRWIGVWALAMARAQAGTAEDCPVARGLRQGYERTTARYEELLQALLDRVGLRVRPGITLRQVTVIAIALSEGCAVGLRGLGRDRVVCRPTGPGGAEEEWTLFAVGLDALCRAFLEPVPGWRPRDRAEVVGTAHEG